MKKKKQFYLHVSYMAYSKVNGELTYGDALVSIDDTITLRRIRSEVGKDLQKREDYDTPIIMGLSEISKDLYDVLNSDNKTV